MAITDDIASLYHSLDDAARKKLAEQVTLATRNLKFVPNKGPQTVAFYHPADHLLYGGSAGGGKSALITGMALTSHRRTLLLRREYSDLNALVDQLLVIHGSRDGFVGSPKPKLVTEDKRTVEFGACQHAGDEEAFQGQARDFYGFDEVTQFLEQQVRFIVGWNRPGPGVPSDQRCRVVFASNPPTSSEGDWIVPYFAPWLDPMFPNRAEDGELRWVVSDPDGKDMWVDGPEPVQFPGQKRPSIPKSRSFIRSRLEDNPYLVNTEYAATLDGLPEPFRSAYRDGNFMMARQDNARQVIPTQWVREAQARWKPLPPPGIPMCSMGVDPAAGGADSTTLAMRYDFWFDKIVKIAGRNTPLGSDVAAQIIKHRRDGAEVVIDMGGGYGSSPYEHMKDNEISVSAYKGAESARGKSACGKLKFKNRRAEALWRMREALDPSQPGGSKICLPDDAELMGDLTAPLFTYTSSGVTVETKEDVKKKLGRSPDKGDAVMLANLEGKRGLVANEMWSAQEHGGGSGKRTPQVNLGHNNKRRK